MDDVNADGKKDFETTLMNLFASVAALTSDNDLVSPPANSSTNAAIDVNDEAERPTPLVDASTVTASTSARFVSNSNETIGAAVAATPTPTSVTMKVASKSSRARTQQTSAAADGGDRKRARRATSPPLSSNNNTFDQTNNTNNNAVVHSFDGKHATSRQRNLDADNAEEEDDLDSSDPLSERRWHSTTTTTQDILMALRRVRQLLYDTAPLKSAIGEQQVCSLSALSVDECALLRSAMLDLCRAARAMRRAVAVDDALRDALQLAYYRALSNVRSVAELRRSLLTQTTTAFGEFTCPVSFHVTSSMSPLDESKTNEQVFYFVSIPSVYCN
jgi:hypothetical protein